MQAQGQLDYMVQFMRFVLGDIGPRPACSQAELKAAEAVAKEWQPYCSSVEIEGFRCSPHAFLGSLRVGISLFAVAVLSSAFKFDTAAFILAVLGAAVMGFEHVGYSEFVDFLFPRRESQNVVGRIAPHGELKQRLLVSAHLDSAYEFTLWKMLGGRFAIVAIVWLVALLGMLALAGLILMIPTVFATHAHVVPTLRQAMAGLLVLLPVFLFLNTWESVPGAMDDLAGVAVLGGLARGLTLPGAERRGLRFTEVVLLATGCEEAGTRGAKRFLRRHRASLADVPTCGIFIDGVCQAEHLAAVDRELGTMAKHDASLIELARELGAERGWDVGRVDIPIGGTDGGPFSRAGVRAVTLVSMDCSTLIPNYHTHSDTLENVEAESLVRMLQLVSDMAMAIDAEAHQDLLQSIAPPAADALPSSASVA